jgi:hypothetical protein
MRKTWYTWRKTENVSILINGPTRTTESSDTDGYIRSTQTVQTKLYAMSDLNNKQQANNKRIKPSFKTTYVIESP